LILRVSGMSCGATGANLNDSAPSVMMDALQEWQRHTKLLYMDESRDDGAWRSESLIPADSGWADRLQHSERQRMEEIRKFEVERDELQKLVDDYRHQNLDLEEKLLRKEQLLFETDERRIAAEDAKVAAERFAGELQEESRELREMLSNCEAKVRTSNRASSAEAKGHARQLENVKKSMAALSSENEALTQDKVELEALLKQEQRRTSALLKESDKLQKSLDAFRKRDNVGAKSSTSPSVGELASSLNVLLQGPVHPQSSNFLSSSEVSHTHLLERPSLLKVCKPGVKVGEGSGPVGREEEFVDSKQLDEVSLHTGRYLDRIERSKHDVSASQASNPFVSVEPAASAPVAPLMMRAAQVPFPAPIAGHGQAQPREALGDSAAWTPDRRGFVPAEDSGIASDPSLRTRAGREQTQTARAQDPWYDNGTRYGTTSGHAAMSHGSAGATNFTTFVSVASQRLAPAACASPIADAFPHGSIHYSAFVSDDRLDGSFRTALHVSPLETVGTRGGEGAREGHDAEGETWVEAAEQDASVGSDATYVSPVKAAAGRDQLWASSAAEQSLAGDATVICERQDAWCKHVTLSGAGGAGCLQTEGAQARPMSCDDL